MGRSFQKRQVAGQGTCSTPRCEHEKLPDSNFCQDCKANLTKIRIDFEEDPRSLYNQRSDNPNRKKLIGKYASNKPKPKRHIPTCKHLGCFEIRIPPSFYCLAHEGDHGEDF